MFDKVVGFPAAVAWSGIVAFFLSLVAGLILSILILLAMILVSIIAGDGVSNWVMHAVDQVGFRILYAVVFVTVLIDELGMQQLRTSLLRWWKDRRGTKTGG